MSSDTPRTDDRQRSRIDDHIGDAYDYARDLERDLAAMTAERDAVLDDSIVGRDAALEQINDLERDLAATTAERDRCRNSVVEAMVAFPNVGEYVAQLEADRDRARLAALREVRKFLKAIEDCPSCHYAIAKIDAMIAKEQR